MDYVPIDRLFYVDLDCPNGGQSNQSCRVLPKFGRPPTIWEISKAKKNLCYFLNSSKTPPKHFRMLPKVLKSSQEENWIFIFFSKIQKKKLCYGDNSKTSKKALNKILNFGEISIWRNFGTAYGTLIWTVQMDDGPMNCLFYVISVVIKEPILSQTGWCQCWRIE